ncbi:MAG: tungstate ABC transporter substrate-binding protein WtpA [Bacteroidales bacterium]|nr:tungstate ABC transporter substrate-binding protein WtpA [Bacteroidales bacterium]
MKCRILTLVLLTIVAISFTHCNNTSTKETTNNKLTIFHAGSLSVPFKQMAEAFKLENPGVEILMEAGGSRKCARKISDLNKECDIMASADYTVIDKLLIPAFAEWNIKFASNEMALVYHDGSRFSDEISAENWYEILLKDDVAFGRSDPNSDPCGYRAVLTTKLAEKHYAQEGLSEKLLAKDNNYIRPKETDLLALLESNTIDYIYLYRSVAEQHHLNYVLLPDEINLKRPEKADFYKQVTVDISGKKAGEVITKKGEPMVYGITMVKNAPNKELAIKFLDYVLSEKGKSIMEKNGQPSMVGSISETYDAIPEQLKKYAIK